MGENKYTLTFEPPSFKEPAFWSATMYDFNNNYTVENPINRYAGGWWEHRLHSSAPSRSARLARNAAGRTR